MGLFSIKKCISKSPIPLLFVARMLVIYLIWIGPVDHVQVPFLPFWKDLDLLRELVWIYPFLDLLFWGSMTAILLGFKFQKFSLILAFLIFLQILSSKNLYSTSFLYSGCMFLLIGVFRPTLEWTFRVQIALLYLGAGLNKLVDIDWLNGQFFKNFILGVYPNILNLNLSSWLGLEFLARSISYLTISLELGLGLWAITGKKQTQFVLAVLLFHFNMLVFTLGELSFIYFYLMATTSYLTLNWSSSVSYGTINLKKKWFWTFLEFTDFDNFFEWKFLRLDEIHLFRVNKETETEFSYVKLLLYHKFFFFAITSSIVFLCWYKNDIVNLLKW